jgi:hypothetical protein
MEDSGERFFVAFDRLDEFLRLQSVLLLCEMGDEPTLEEYERERDALLLLKHLVGSFTLEL